MPIPTSLNPICSRHWIPALAISLIALTAPATLRAANIEEGDVTNVLGPTFFVDDATLGGSDTDINQPRPPLSVRLFDGLLSPNQGPTRVTLTGFGFATHTSEAANDASTMTVTFTYLGADAAVGGGDDVIIGSATGNFIFTGRQGIRIRLRHPLDRRSHHHGHPFPHSSGTGQDRDHRCSHRHGPETQDRRTRERTFS